MRTRIVPELATAGRIMAKNPVQVQKVEVPGITNYSRLDDATVGFGGATQPSAMAWLKKQGFASVINLRLATEKGVNIEASRAAAEAAGLNYIHLPFDVTNPDPQLFHNLQVAFGDKANQPTYIHCASANRVGYIWMIKRVLVGRLGHRQGPHRGRGDRTHAPRPEGRRRRVHQCAQEVNRGEMRRRARHCEVSL